LHLLPWYLPLQDKFGGPLNLIRDTSKEISDRVADRYPVQPPVLTAQALVDQMVSTNDYVRMV
jgi:hypothetical protein